MVPILLVASIAVAQRNPVFDIASPVDLARALPNPSSEGDRGELLKGSNLAIRQLAQFPRHKQIQFELAYLTVCHQHLLPEKTVKINGKDVNIGTPYTWGGEWDLGTLDVIAVAAGRRSVLNKNVILRCLLSPTTSIRPGVKYGPKAKEFADRDMSGFNPYQIYSFRSASAYRKVRRRVTQGYFVLRRGH